MTITVDIRPEVEAELIRQAAAHGRAIEAHAATLLEDAVHLQAEPASVRTGQALPTGQTLIDACAKVRGVLTDDEIDTLFSRNQSFARPVDFE
jgi:plasmid stability protein